MNRISVLFWFWIITTNQFEKTAASRDKLISNKQIGSQCILLPVEQYSLESIVALETPKNNSESETHTRLETETLSNNISETLAKLSSKPRIRVYSKIVHSLKWNIHLPLLLVLLCLISYMKMTLTREARMINQFSGPKIIPFFGTVLSLIGPFENLMDFFSQSMKKYRGYGRMWLFNAPCLIISDAEGAQAVLGGRDDFYRNLVADKLSWALTTGLITAQGEIWKHDRKLLEHYFKYQRVHRFLNVFNKHSKVLIQNLKNLFEAEQRSVDLKPILDLCTMDLISETTLGIATSYQTNPTHGFTTAFQELAESFRTRLLKPYMNLPIIWHVIGNRRKEARCKKYFKDNLTPIIEAHRKKREISEQKSDDDTEFFIDALLDAGKTHEEIVGHVLTMFAAGFETSASAMNYTLFLLALNVKCQERVHLELDEIFGMDRNRDITLNDLAEMKYLEMCIKESLRLFPPAPYTERVPTKDITLKCGRVIPAGCSVVFYTYGMHRDPKQFPDPEKFLPERFLPEECVKRHPFAYAPFSAGARNCMGQKYAMLQMKTVLGSILRNFTVSTESTQKELKLIPGIVLEPAGGGINLKLTKIK